MEQQLCKSLKRYNNKKWYRVAEFKKQYDLQGTLIDCLIATFTTTIGNGTEIKVQYIEHESAVDYLTKHNKWREND